MNKNDTQWVQTMWNTLAPSSLPRCRIWSQRMHQKADKLIREFGGPDEFRPLLEEAIQAIADSDHCMGHNSRGWRASIQFLLCVTNQNAFDNLINGVYANKPSEGDDAPKTFTPEEIREMYESE